jgi:hypothetical protein
LVRGRPVRRHPAPQSRTDREDFKAGHKTHRNRSLTRSTNWSTQYLSEPQPITGWAFGIVGRPSGNRADRSYESCW